MRKLTFKKFGFKVQEKFENPNLSNLLNRLSETKYMKFLFFCL